MEAVSLRMEGLVEEEKEEEEVVVEVQGPQQWLRARYEGNGRGKERSDVRQSFSEPTKGPLVVIFRSRVGMKVLSSWRTFRHF